MTELNLPKDVEGIIANIEDKLERKIEMKKFWGNLALNPHKIGSEKELDRIADCYAAIINLLSRQITKRVVVLSRIYDASPILFTKERSDRFMRYTIFQSYPDDYTQDL